jgi:glycosyltransferase involved in cell wall biosynthesis
MTTNNSIAFVANTSWSIYKFRLNLLKTLIRHGYQIYVLAPRDSYTQQFESIPGLTYIELFKFRGKSISPLKDRALYRELKQHYRRIRPDLIFHYTIKATIYGTLAANHIKRPSVSVITGLGYVFSGPSLLQTAVKLIYRKVLRMNKEVWFLNADDQSSFLRSRLVPEKKTFILPGEGVDTELFHPAPYEPAKRPPSAPLTFLLIARIIRHKGIYEFIEAATLLKEKGLNVQFQLLGFFDEGNPVQISYQQVHEWVLEQKVSYLGQTDDVAPFIEAADCIVLPSYREGMPLSLLEGASMCKALIATDTAGCRDIIQDGVNGYLCRQKDGQDLADKMEKYYQLPSEDKRQMGIAGRERILQHFTQEIITQIYLGKLSSLLKPSGQEK